MKFGLTDTEIESIQKVLEAKSNIDKALLFGSRAKGNFRNDSDIDIALIGFDLSFDDILLITQQLEELTLPYEFDVLDYSKINEPELVEHIDRVGIEFYSRWKEKKLGNVINFQRGYDLTRNAFKNGKYPVGGSNGHIGLHDSYTTKGPGVTIGRSGSIGTPQFYKNDFWAHNTVLYVNDFKESSPQFIYYLLKTIDFTQFNAGSSVPTLNRNHIHELDLLIPPPIEQKAIALTLASLDDKIDLLQRQNKTLEQLAETLFRQWFIEEADESWEIGRVDDLFILQRGHDLPSQSRLDGTYPIISSSGINGYHDIWKVRGPGVSTGRSGVIGKVFYITEDFWPLNTSLFVREYKIATPLFAYFYLKTIDLKNLNGGSAVPTLNRNDVHSLEIPF